MTSSAPAISVQAIAKSYGAHRAVDGVDLELQAGRITCLLGPSGCGKSTLLRLIAGFEPADKGQILAGGILLSSPDGFTPPEERGIGLVFQDSALFPHLTVLQNVSFGLTRLARPERRRRALALLEQVHMAEHAGAWPHMLSGGQQQRVALARALAPQPAAVLLDEPFSSLDAHLRASVRETVVDVLRGAGAAVLVVTHDAEDAFLMADDLALMSHGRIIRRGAPRDCYLKPGSLAAARLLGDVNILPATVAAGRAMTIFGDIPAPDIANGEALLLIRPEALRLGGPGPLGEVATVRFTGAMYEVELRSGDHSLRLRTPSEPPPIGASVELSTAPQACTIVGA